MMNWSVDQVFQLVMRQQMLPLANTLKDFCLICRILKGKPGRTSAKHFFEVILRNQTSWVPQDMTQALFSCPNPLYCIANLRQTTCVLNTIEEKTSLKDSVTLSHGKIKPFSICLVFLYANEQGKVGHGLATECS